MTLYILFFFLYFDGCIITNIEYKLCKNKNKFVNVIDPFLCILGREINSNNRYNYSILWAILYLGSCFIILLYKFTNNPISYYDDWIVYFNNVKTLATKIQSH